MLPEKAFQPVGKRMTLEGGGGGVVKSIGKAVGGVGGAVGNAVGSLGGVGKVLGPAIQLGAGQSPLSVFGGALGAEVAKSMLGGGGGSSGRGGSTGAGGVMGGGLGGKPIDITLDAYRKAYPNLTPYTTPAYQLNEPTYDEWVRKQVPTYDPPSNRRLQYNFLFGPNTPNANNPLRPEFDVWKQMNRDTPPPPPLTPEERAQRIQTMMDNFRNGRFFFGQTLPTPNLAASNLGMEEQRLRKQLEDLEGRARREMERKAENDPQLRRELKRLEEEEEDNHRRGSAGLAGLAGNIWGRR